MEESGLENAIGEALEAMVKALVILMQVIMLVLVQALRAVFIVAAPLTKFASVAAMVAGAVVLFRSVFMVYGQDVVAIMLALAVVVTLPTFLLVMQPDKTWGAFLSSGALAGLVSIVLPVLPVIVRALLPVAMLAGCILYFAFGQKAQPTNESEVTSERE